MKAMKTKSKQRIVCFVCMLTSILTGAGVGLFLDWLFLPRTIVCGSVAIVSTIIEHFLTLNQDKFVKLLENIEEGSENENQ